MDSDKVIQLPGKAGAQPPSADFIGAVLACLRLLGSPKTREVIASQLTPGTAEPHLEVQEALRALDFEADWVKIRLEEITEDLLPAVVLFADGGASVLAKLDDRFATLSKGEHLESERLARSSFAARFNGEMLVIRNASNRDVRADEWVPPSATNWFWPVIWRYRRYYYEAMSLAAIINILTLSGIIFMLTVYDRVLPNQAYVTLWSLAAGVAVAMVLEFLSRTARTWVLDSAGKKIDLVLGDSVFNHALRSRLEFRAQSSGAFANIFKEFEQVRAFVTSASLVAIADLPFAFLFIGVTAIIAGPLFLVPLAAFVVVTILALLLQWPLAKLAQEGLRESSVRHGTVIESLEGLDTLKTARAEPRMRARYDVSSEVISRTALKSSTLSGLTLNATVLVQQLGTVVLLVWGVYLVASGEVTSGAIIAAVQLTSRALAPLTNLTSLAMRFQHVRTAMASLNRVMKIPVEREAGRQYLSGTHWRGDLEVKAVTFSYRQDTPPVLREASLSIRRGERVAIVGRMGGGKSTLLRILAGLYRPTKGSLMIDGVDASQIEPADVRATTLLLPQDGRLFHGSLRENLAMSAPTATDEEILRFSEWTGVKAIAASHPKAFEQLVGERGDTLSAGQRQAIALTRVLLAHPKVYLLDEPTSSMDQASETSVLQGLRDHLGDATLVVVTHKASLLALVDRLIVIDNGMVVADGPKMEVLKALNDGRVRTV
ncbi:MAG: type I secretion system permease/ATPase [Burkholderiales bacterium]